jgi:hypothetical protein
LKHRLNGAVHGDLLIVAKGLGPVWKCRRQQPFSQLVVEHALCVTEPGPEVIRRREIPNGSLDTACVIEFDNLDTIGRIREPQSKDFGILLGLLKPFRSVRVAGLGLNYCDWEVWVIPKQIVRALLFTSASLAADKYYSAVSEGSLLVYGVRAIVPACCLQLWDDELPAGIGLVHAVTTDFPAEVANAINDHRSTARPIRSAWREASKSFAHSSAGMIGFGVSKHTRLLIVRSAASISLP